MCLENISQIFSFLDIPIFDFSIGYHKIIPEDLLIEAPGNAHTGKSVLLFNLISGFLKKRRGKITLGRRCTYRIARNRGAKMNQITEIAHENYAKESLHVAHIQFFIENKSK